MKSIITSKFQTTIPKAVRKAMHLSVNDALEWTVEDGRLIVQPVHNAFLDHKNSVATGAGDIAEDLERARQKRAEDAA